MRNLLRLIYRYYFFLLFIIIEVISFFLIIQYNSYQNASFFNSSKFVTGIIYESFTDFTDYVNLKEKNQKLAWENAVLRNLLKSNYKSNKINKWELNDSIFQKQYIYRYAKIINNTVNKQNNYITIDKGLKHGIKPGMGAVSGDGLVGIVKDASNNYSTIISIINKDLKISAKIKKNGYFGSVSWTGRDYKYCNLNEIPYHVNLSIGDTIITSGYSSVFPEGILIGKISEFDKDQSSNFYNIKVELNNDLKKVAFVYVIENVFHDEIEKIESVNND